MMSKERSNLIPQAFADGFRPDKILSISEWADKYRQLPESNSEPGRWRTSRTPYLEQVMDDFSPSSPTQKVVIMKGAQLGFTEALLNVSFYYIDYKPANQMLIYPTKEIAERTSKNRIVKSAQAMPSLRDKIGVMKKKDATETILQKDYEGGSLFLSGANSPATLCSIAVLLVIGDEVDRFPEDCGGEGNPVDLAEKRTSTYSRTRKIGLISTPVNEGTSVITQEFKASDQSYFFVPCPYCEQKQKLEYGNLIFEFVDDRLTTDVKYQCQYCYELIPESFKTKMLDGGEWRATEFSETRGYHLNGLYSPIGWTSWRDIVIEDLKSRQDPRKRKVWLNTRLGLPYSGGGESPDVDLVFARREPYEIGVCPFGALFVTAAVDVQGDWLEFESVAWGLNGESWSLEHRIFQGDTGTKEVWDGLESYIRDKLYPVKDSNLKLPIQLCGVDSGYRSQHVYRFVRRFGGRRVYALKGRDTYDMMLSRPSKVDIVLTDSKTIKMKTGKVVDLYHVGSSLLKEEFYTNLNLKEPENGEPYPFGYCHFPEYSRKFFESLCSEKCMTSIVGGRSVRKWVKVYERNEALDIRCYNMAMACLYGYFRKSQDELERLYNSLYDTFDKKIVDRVQDVKDGGKNYKVERVKGSFF